MINAFDLKGYHVLTQAEVRSLKSRLIKFAKQKLLLPSEYAEEWANLTIRDFQKQGRSFVSCSQILDMCFK